MSSFFGRRRPRQRRPFGVMVEIDGWAMNLAASDADGPILVTARDGTDTVLIGVDLSGQVLWRRRFASGVHLSRIGEDGTVWVPDRDGTEVTLTAVDQAGKVLRSVTPESVPGDRIGSFVVLSDGFCVAWLPSYLASKDVTVGAGRVAVHSTDGAHLRSTWADLGALSYEGVVEWRADNNWEPRPKEPWVPRDIETAYWDPILVSRDRIAATFVEDRSGIGVTFFIATDTGDILSRTAPGPTGYNAVIGPGEFLLGHQGYGAFTTAHHNDRGKVVREWTTHAMLLIDRHGDIRGPSPRTSRLPGRGS